MTVTMDAVPNRPLSRLTGRLVAEMQFQCVVEMLALFDGKLERAIIFLVILRQDRLLRGRGKGVVSVDDGEEAGISVNAIGTSLGRPFETVRRQVKALVDAGLCARTPTGMVVVPAALEEPRVAAALVRLHDSMVALVEQLDRYGVGLAPRERDLDYDWRTTLAAAIDLFLTIFEFGSGGFLWSEMLLIWTVVLANARPVTLDRRLAYRYAEHDTPPPAAIRQPVRISAVARTLRMSNSSVARHAANVRAAGILVDTPDGLLATDDYLANPLVVAAGRFVSVRALQTICRMAPGGFRFEDPASCYIEGKPPMIQFV